MSTTARKSTHMAVVVPVVLKPHPNADSLSIVDVDNTYQVVVRTADWANVDRGVYVPPQNLVPLDRPEFAFLDKPRIKPVRLRGEWSYGLLIPCAEHWDIGTDVTDYYGITHWEPEEQHAIGPRIYCGKSIFGGPFDAVSKYDIDGAQHVWKLVPAGTPVFVTEKIHGANWRCYSEGDQLYVGSRQRWVADDESSVHWQAFRWLQSNSDVARFLREWPNHIL